MPDFVILANTHWDPPTGGGNSSQQYANAMLRRGWRVCFLQRDGVEVLTPLRELQMGPETVAICDLPFIDFYYDTFMRLRDLGCRTVYRVVDNWLLTPCRYYSEARELAFIKAADLVVCSSPLNIGRFINTRPDITLLRNGVDLPRFRDWQGERPADLVIGQPTLVFMASFWDRSWVDWQALLYAAEKLPQASFNLLGDRERIGLTELPDNLHLLGTKRHELLPAYLRHSDVGLLTYNPGRTWYNNPVKVLEYLAAGLPVVSCPNISIANYPYIFPYRTPEECVRQIAQASRTPLDHDYLQQVLEQHTWETRLDLLLAKLAGAPTLHK